MRLLSSNLSKTRRRIYGLLGVGLAVALGASVLGGLIVLLGHSQPDVVQPFWESGEYVALLGLFNLGIYAALLWQVGRLSRRDGRKSTSVSGVLGADNPDPEAGANPPAAAPLGPSPSREHMSPARPKITRRVRGNISSLRLDPP